MRFSNRLKAPSQEVFLRRQRKYLEDLRRQGFSSRDPLYQYFGGEVFHDGELRLPKVDPAGRRVTLRLRNVYAVDRVCAELLRTKGSSKHLRRSDFVTLVSFSGVSAFSLDLAECEGELELQCSRLSRRGPEAQLDIRCLDPRSRVGTLRIRFSQVAIEDISSRLKKYVPVGIARSCLCPSLD